MSKKAGIAHERAVMFSKFSEMNLSVSVCDRICLHMGSFDPKNHEAKEAEAKKINAVLASSKTEAEILEKLEAMA